jgi:2-iminobutanoate/2-iminopropanoate deaminase
MKSALTTCILLLGFIANAQTEDIIYVQSDRPDAKSLPFSPAVIVGNTIYLSGQIGTKEGKLVPGGIVAETKQIMDNIRELLEKNGSSMDKVVKCTCMLADIAEWSTMNSEYVKYFPKHKPARSAFGTSGLALGARVEIECIAVR